MTVSEWKGSATVPVDLLWWLSKSELLPDDTVCGIHRDFILMLRPVYRRELVRQPDGYWKSVPVEFLYNQYYFLSADSIHHPVFLDEDQFHRYLNLSTVQSLI